VSTQSAEDIKHHIIEKYLILRGFAPAATWMEEFKQKKTYNHR
jgi:hypothetical protein